MPLFPLLVLGGGAFFLWNMFAPETTVSTQTRTETTQGTDPFDPGGSGEAEPIPPAQSDSGGVLFPDLAPDETTPPDETTAEDRTEAPPLDETPLPEAEPPGAELPSELPPTEPASGITVPDLSPTAAPEPELDGEPAPGESEPTPEETGQESPESTASGTPETSDGEALPGEGDPGAVTTPEPAPTAGEEADPPPAGETAPDTELPAEPPAPAETANPPQPGATPPASPEPSDQTPNTQPPNANSETASTPGQAISADEARELAQRYLSANARSGLSEAMGLYAAQIDYFGRGVLPKSVVYSDKLAYVRRWPQREYRLSSGVNTLAADAGRRTVRFDYDYTITADGAARSGTAYVVLTLVREGGEVKIAGETGGLYP